LVIVVSPFETTNENHRVTSACLEPPRDLCTGQVVAAWKFEHHRIYRTELSEDLLRRQACLSIELYLERGNAPPPHLSTPPDLPRVQFWSLAATNI
jgi:hypothetical protein